MKLLVFLCFCACCSYSFISKSSTPDVIVPLKITNVRSAEGNMVLGFYKDNASFSKRQPFMSKTYSKKNLKNGVVVYNIELPNGTYGIALLDDENKNGKVDYGFILPNEGFGFSNYYHRGLTSPNFDRFAFQVDGSGKEVVVKMKYM